MYKKDAGASFTCLKSPPASLHVFGSSKATLTVADSLYLISSLSSSRSRPCYSFSPFIEVSLENSWSGGQMGGKRRGRRDFAQGHGLVEREELGTLGIGAARAYVASATNRAT